MKHIVFLLPGGAGRITGGCKIVLEYANRFVKDGYKISIVYPSSMFYHKASFKGKVKMMLRYIYNIFTKRYSCKKWFKLEPEVKEEWVWSLKEKFVPKADYYVATGVDTSVYLNDYNIPNKNKFYFIQHFETWVEGFDENAILNTYRFDINKIVISNWLKDIVVSINEKCTLIPNGFDFDYFKCSNNIAERDKFTITMLYHKETFKGIEDGLKALKLVKAKYPQLKVNLFGVYNKPNNLPDWCTYYQAPDKATHNKIYNEASIFLGTSRSEGWGLTVGEAMICGCAIVCTDTKGYLEMAENNVNALVVPIMDVNKMAEAIIKLIENDELRIKLAIEGNNSIKRFNWDSSYDCYKKTIINNK